MGIEQEEAEEAEKSFTAPRGFSLLPPVQKRLTRLICENRSRSIAALIRIQRDLSVLAESARGAFQA